MRRTVVSPVVLRLVPLAAAPALAVSKMSIPEVHCDARGNDNHRQNFNDEYAVFKNNTSRVIRMDGWKVHDRGCLHTHRFPKSFRLAAGKGVTLHSGRGSSGKSYLDRGRSYGAVRSNGGGTVTLGNRSAESVARRSW